MRSFMTPASSPTPSQPPGGAESPYMAGRRKGALWEGEQQVSTRLAPGHPLPLQTAGKSLQPLILDEVISLLVLFNYSYIGIYLIIWKYGERYGGFPSVYRRMRKRALGLKWGRKKSGYSCCTRGVLISTHVCRKQCCKTSVKVEEQYWYPQELLFSSLLCSPYFAMYFLTSAGVILHYFWTCLHK